jgi:signal transduction histidine kinase
VDVSDPRFAGWLMGSLRAGLVAIDGERRVVVLNHEARRVLRFPEGKPSVGCPVSVALSAHPKLIEALLGALAGAEPTTRAELALDPAEEGAPPRTLGFSAVPILDEDGGRRGAALVFRDLTPYERIEEQERLRERLAALGQMAAGLAHEIRNPLAGMEVLAGLLRRRLDGQTEELALLDELVRELRRVARTVTDALEFVRPLAPSRAPVDPVELLEESLARARSRVAFAGRIEREYDEELPRVLADPEQLEAVMTDLLVNALEAMQGQPPEACQLRVALRVTDADPARSLVIRVTDTGPGVPPELREKIFYPFFTTKERGSGVGLANAQKVAASHGGELVLQSRDGRGAAFVLRLPADEPASLAAASERGPR